MGTKHIVGNLEVEGKVSAPNLVTTDGGTITGPLWVTDGTTEYGFTVVDGPLGVRVHGAADEAGSQPPTIYGYGAIEYHKQDGTGIYLNLPNKNSSYVGTLALTDDIPTDKINLLERALFPAGTKYTADITDEYNGRTTADGENVLDGTLAVVKTVEGDTAACENLFNVEQNLNLMQGCLWEEDTQTLVAPIKTSYAFMQNVRKFPYPIPAGTKVSLTVFCESGNLTGTATISLRDGNTATNCVVSFPKDTDLKGKTYTKTATLDIAATNIMIFFNNPVNVTTEIRVRVVINIGDAPKMFTPFYTGLKNASFQGLVSTKRNYFDITQMPTTGNFIIDGNDITVANCYAANTGKTLRQLFPYVIAGKTYKSIYTATCSQEIIAGNTAATGSIRVYYTDSEGTSKTLYFALGGCEGEERAQTVTIPEEALDSAVFFYGQGRNAITTWKNFRLVELEGETEVTDDLTLPTAIDLGYGTVIDFENQQIVENYGSYTFTGEEKWGVPSTNLTDDGYYRNFLAFDHTSVDNLPMKGGTRQFGFCDRIPIDTVDSWAAMQPYKLRLGQSNGLLYLTTPTQSTREELQALTKGMTIRYPLRTPIITPFTDAQKFVGKTYTAYNHGMEMVVCNTNEDFTKPTITQNYVLVEEV